METSFLTSHLLLTSGNMKTAATEYLQEKWSIESDFYPHLAWFGEEESALKIATVRNLQEHLSFAQTAKHPRYVIIIGIDSATIPAQNALLKIVEEPPAHTQLLLVGHELSAILPTIQSRCVLSVKTVAAPETTEAAEIYSQLVGTDIPVALNLAENYTDRAAALTLTVTLLTELHAQLEKRPSEKLREDLKVVISLKRQLEANCNVQLVVEEAFLQLIWNSFEKNIRVQRRCWVIAK